MQYRGEQGAISVTRQFDHAIQPLPIYFVDAFASRLFTGNPAAVVPLQSWLADELMQAIASENNLSETAFVVPDRANTFHIRWFSPATEVDFCGHATLAAAFALLNYQGQASPLQFWAKALGRFTVTELKDRRLEMNLPNMAPEPVDEIPEALITGISITPTQVLKNRQAYFVVLASEQDVRAVEVDLTRLQTLSPLDVVITARGNAYDFVSRYFWPANGGTEDPVTGSIHTGLAPYWARETGKSTLIALQASKRGGVLFCRVAGDRVFISGHCAAYLQGLINIKTSAA